MKFREHLAYLMYQDILNLADPGRKQRMSQKYRGRYMCEIAMHKQLLRLAFPDETKANDKQRRNPDHPNYPARRLYLTEATKRYARRNPEKMLAGTLRYQARKRAARSGNREAVRRVYRRAKELRQWFNVVVDHIIPFTKGGLDCADNLQIIYRLDNDRKGVRLDYVPSVIFT